MLASCVIQYHVDAPTPLFFDGTSAICIDWVPMRHELIEHIGVVGASHMSLQVQDHVVIFHYVPSKV